MTELGNKSNKTVRFGLTTNGTLVSEEFVSFAVEDGLYFHLSFDGLPEFPKFPQNSLSGKIFHFFTFPEYFLDF
jgi:MoaA/NifB/PqqE/SkfB family radical SAM enzyme